MKSSSGCYSESQGQVAEVKDADGGVLRDVLSHSGDMGLDDMISIEIGHFSSCLDPNLVLAILGQIVEAGNIQSKLSTLGKLADE